MSDPTQTTGNDLLDRLAQAGLFEEQLRPLRFQQQLAQSMMGAPGAQGRNVGNTYVAASPLEHLSGLAQKLVGAFMQQRAMGKEQDLARQLGQTRGDYGKALADAAAPVQHPPEMLQAPGYNPAAEDQVKQQRLQQLATSGMLSGDPEMSQVGQRMTDPRLALARQSLDQSAQKFPLELAMEKQKLAAGGPQEALGGQTPSTFEMLTKRQQVPKFAAAAPGSTIFNTRTGPVAGANGAAGNDIIKQTADGIENGTAPPDMKGLGRLRVPVQAELATRGFNLSQANLDWQATQKHLATLNSGGQERLNQAINFVSDTIPVIRQLYAEWQQIAGQSGFKVINKATLAAMKQLPGRAGAVAQALDTQINDFGAELGTVYKGGGTSTDKSLGMAASNLQADWNPETFNKALDLAEKNIALRKNSMTHSNVRGTSSGNPYAPQPPTTQEPAPAAGGAKKKIYNPATGQIEER